MIKSYSLSNKERDLSSVMSTVVAEQGRFLSYFKAAPKATNHKHEWLQDRIAGRQFKVTAYASGKATLSAEDYIKVKVGTRFVVKGSPVVFKVTGVENGNKITASVHSANGNTTKTVLAANDICKIISTPVAEASTNGAGESTQRSVGSACNFTQIIRKECEISGSALETATIDQVENNMTRQTEHALQETSRDMNRCAVWGVKTEANNSTGEVGEAGGLYSFCTKSVNAAGARLDSTIVNDGVQEMMNNGGNPTLLCCSPSQARVLANENKNKVTILRDDKKRGVFANMVVNETNNQSIDIIGDPDFDDCDAFLVDDAGLYISYKREIKDRDSSNPKDDFISRLILGEFTFEFRNAAERIVKITNLKDPASALEELKSEANTVTINATEVNVTSASSSESNSDTPSDPA